jgi:hypothetical protein
MPCTQGGGSFSHVKPPHLEDDQGEHYYEHVEYQSSCMPIRPSNTYVLWLQDQHQLEEAFTDIVIILNFNKFSIYA